MPRSQNKVASHRRRKRILSRAKGYWGARSKVLTVAKHHIDKAGQHAYRDRRLKKRDFRQLWIARINAAARLNGTTYSRLIDGMKKKAVEINRKVLAELAVSNPEVFTEIVKFAAK
jgi:large subunit ribosomal protein L20